VGGNVSFREKLPRKESELDERGKKYQESVKLVDKTKLYDPVEAMELVQKTAKAKFDETVEAHIRLGVDSDMPISR